MMNQYSYWTDLSQLIDRALELEPDIRLSFLRNSCSGNPELFNEAKEYLSYIEKAENEQFLESNMRAIFDLKSGLEAGAISETGMKPVEGHRVGPYEIREPVGEGGMGMVYLAERADGEFDQTVAIKFLRGGFFSPTMRDRFRREKQILAKLNHPNIAGIIDGGITEEGTPYIILEYVKGVPVDEYCKDNKLRIADRIDLFLQICKAVQYAHSQLIIHRDLKPDNIFVTEEGQIKVMDFGIAKFLNPGPGESSFAQTREGSHVASMEFAAPEQFSSSDPTTATDVYGLGVLLYLIATGKKPFTFDGLSLTEARCRIETEAPPDPSGQSDPGIGTIDSDLKAIILKALRKEAEERYETVLEFSADLQRYIHHKPVRARQGNTIYRAKKFLRRNSRSLLAALVIIVVLSGFTIYHLQTVNRQLEQISLEAETAQSVTDFIVDLFDVSDPVRNADRILTASALLERGQSRFDGLDLKPDVQLELLGELGRASMRLGDYINAEAIYFKADSIARNHFPPNSHEVADAALNLGIIHTEHSKFFMAETYLERAKLFFSDKKEDYREEYSELLLHLGISLMNTNRPDSALATISNALDFDHADPSNSQKIIELRLVKARAQTASGEFTSAENILLDVLTDIKQLGFERYDIHRSALVSMGNLNYYRKEYQQANSFYRAAMEHSSGIYGDLHPNTLKPKTQFMYSYIYLEDYDKAIQEAKEMLRAKIIRHGEHSTWAADGHATMGLFYALSGDFSNSITSFNTSYSLHEDINGPDNPWTNAQKLFLSFSLHLTGQTDESASYFYDAFSKLSNRDIEPDFNASQLILRYVTFFENNFPKELKNKIEILREAGIVPRV